METKNKTPWRKHLDTRYISGEDLLNSFNGLKPEMVVTLTKYADAPTFDQSKQKEVDKTALWLKEYPNGAHLYKPALLNVINGKFLQKEIGNGSIYLDDFDTNKPFILYAMPDKRFGHVARFKKYYPPVKATPDKAIKALTATTTLEELVAVWNTLSAEEKALPSVLAKKDEMKTNLTPKP